jgi:hypothetical protein
VTGWHWHPGGPQAGAARQASESAVPVPPCRGRACALASAARPGRPWPLLRRGPRADGQPINGVNREESLLACDERLAASLMARQTDTSKPARRVTRRGRGVASGRARSHHNPQAGSGLRPLLRRSNCTGLRDCLSPVHGSRPRAEQARYYSAQNRLLGSFVRTLWVAGPRCRLAQLFWLEPVWPAKPTWFDWSFVAGTSA